MSSFLQVENISKSYGDKVLFQNISFNINEGDKIALIAPNGTGKSSLLKILAGLDSSDRGGEIKFMKDIKVAFLDQNCDFNPTNTLFDEVYSRMGDTYEVVMRYEQAIASGDERRIEQAIAALKAEGRYQEIQPTIERLRKEHEIALPKDLAYVEGRLFDDYIHDMKIIQHFATLNRKAMMDVILVGMRLTAVEQFTTIHNYIDTDNMILRKGAVAAYAGQKLLIPINMRDGSLICIGKGNEDWNCSAPHGAGRLMSRRAAFGALSMEEFQKEMEGIYTTCVLPDTLDESPMAYKSMDEIVAQIGPTAEIIERIRPVYNFKAAD